MVLLNEINELKEEQLQVSFVEEQPPIPVPASLKVVGRRIGSNLDVTCSYLADETVGMVGIWGMGGVDDIWAVVDLVELGIPHPRSNDKSTKQYKGKVIFTTRSEELCTKMRADEKIKVECLEPQEAWDLFKENVNLDVIASDVRMKEIARKVMNECSGLPLTLILDPVKP
ncbi:probable disease resistance protein At1g52660 [Dioscorea cayenensis subsp. rotundata]|uniref:Probable disease resistance protein At1g52660 n=1 Tax=Dioscorea cayennensis subsp. rotundata TaxID=55577 RepID=A0AB40AU59_DIOCR|nr:probable disease resistance protein At1g52660 [Dioscorea cayenensis subsp. rotundata]